MALGTVWNFHLKQIKALGDFNFGFVFVAFRMHYSSYMQPAAPSHLVLAFA